METNRFIDPSNWADGKRSLKWIPDEKIFEKVSKDWPKIYDRANSSLWLMLRNNEHWGSTNDGFDSKERGSAALIRGGLAEFVSIEDITKEYFKKKIWISNSTNPILHTIRELRNVSFHVSCLTLTERSVNLSIMNQNGSVSEVSSEFIETIIKLDINDFNKLDNWQENRKPNYNEIEKKFMIETFMKVQNSIGFYELFRRTIEQYLIEIINFQIIEKP
jgi:hypothetical protein